MQRSMPAVVVIAVVALSCLAIGDGLAQESSDSGQVVIGNCRIKLIDTVVLASDRMGILAFVEPEEGDRVTVGQRVAGLRSEVAAAALAIAEKEAGNDIEIRFAKKAAEVARAEYEKSLDANRRVTNAVPDIELRKQLLDAERSELQIEQAEHQFEVSRLTREQAEAELKTYQIEAPFDAIVTRAYKSRGEAVKQGDPILELVSTNRVRVEGDVDITNVWGIKPGARVVVKLDVPNVDLEVERETFEGRIVFVDVSAQPVTRRVRVWAEVANRDNLLRAGLTATMTAFTELEK